MGDIIYPVPTRGRHFFRHPSPLLHGLNPSQPPAAQDQRQASPGQETANPRQPGGEELTQKEHSKAGIPCNATNKP